MDGARGRVKGRRGASQWQAAQRGLSLVELLISIGLGLVVVGALSALFVSSSANRRVLEGSAELLENGRYAMSLLKSELSLAGYYGMLSNPSGLLAKPCSTDADNEWSVSLQIHIQGSNQDDLALQPSAYFPCIDALRDPYSDAVFIQRASTCVAGPNPAPGCEAMFPGRAYLQVSQCPQDNPNFVLKANQDATLETVFNLRTIDKTNLPPTCSAAFGQAPIRYFYRSLYYIGTDHSLWRLDVDANSEQDPPGTPVRLVGNVENMQVEYAIDPGYDGTPDRFAASPDLADWPSVVGIRVWVLSRSDSPDRAYQDDKTYLLGDFCSFADSAANCPDGSTALYRDTDQQHYRRHLFSSYISFINVIGRTRTK